MTDVNESFASQLYYYNDCHTAKERFALVQASGC